MYNSPKNLKTFIHKKSVDFSCKVDVVLPSPFQSS